MNSYSFVLVELTSHAPFLALVGQPIWHGRAVNNLKQGCHYYFRFIDSHHWPNKAQGAPERNR